MVRDRDVSEVDTSIVIVTNDRAEELKRTLSSLAHVRTPNPTELLVVDNNSSDHTKAVVDEMRPAFSYPVRYLFVETPGKYAALNAAIGAAHGEIIVATDDDARFEADWLEQALGGLRHFKCDFVGGRVRPVFCGPRPEWLPDRNGLHDKVIAVLDHGNEPREFGSGISWPLGVNVAYRRSAFERAGLFDPQLGRVAGTLRNQAQREWHLRARTAGLVGVYLPEMVVHHLVPAGRLTKRYFRRWFYWHGISRAILFRQGGFDMEEPDSPVNPQPARRQWFGVPAHLVWKTIKFVRGYAWHSLRGNRVAAFERELALWFFVGLARQRWADRHEPIVTGERTIPKALPAAELGSGSA